MDLAPSRNSLISAIERLQRSAQFWSSVAPIFSAYKLREFGITKSPEGTSNLPDLLPSNRVPGEDIERKDDYDDIHEWGAEKLLDTIENLKGFYVKSGQIVSTRVDLFPRAYTEKLMALQDGLAPLPISQVKQVVQEDLLDGRPMEELFSSFDEIPLGTASIAQVHKATLLDGREVAVKVQRPGIGRLLVGDLANLKVFAKALSRVLPVDYFKVFSELEKVVQYELDFLQEAQAARKVGAAVSHTVEGRPTKPSLKVPMPIPGLASRKVLVMDFINATPLSKLEEALEDENTSSPIPAGPLRDALMRRIGSKLLGQLTEAYGRMIFGAGFIHGDPHPGNLMIEGLNSGNPSLVLLDCGQFKQLSNNDRARLAQLVMLSGELTEKVMLGASGSEEEKKKEQIFQEISQTATEMGLELFPGAPNTTAAAVSLLLFGDPEVPLPSEFASNELADRSPLRQVANFPQHLVLLGRATVMIKGIAKKLGVRWPLGEKWKSMAQHALMCNIPNSNGGTASVPCWSLDPNRCTIPTLHSTPSTSLRSPGSPNLVTVLSSFGSSVQLLALWVWSLAQSPFMWFFSRVVAVKAILSRRSRNTPSLSPKGN